MKRQFTPEFWLQLLTSNMITAEQVSVLEGCDIQTARKRISSITYHQRGMPYVCSTDGYLQKYRYTTRKDELRLIYGDIKK